MRPRVWHCWDYEMLRWCVVCFVCCVCRVCKVHARPQGASRHPATAQSAPQATLRNIWGGYVWINTWSVTRWWWMSRTISYIPTISLISIPSNVCNDRCNPMIPMNICNNIYINNTNTNHMILQSTQAFQKRAEGMGSSCSRSPSSECIRLGFGDWCVVGWLIGWLVGRLGGFRCEMRFYVSVLLPSAWRSRNTCSQNGSTSPTSSKEPRKYSEWVGNGTRINPIHMTKQHICFGICPL